MDISNYYIYCIISNELDNDLPIILGHHNERIFGVTYQKLTAYVSRTVFTHIEADYENLQCHENVIAEVMKNNDVLPMSFSTICKSEENVIEVLKKYYDQFQDFLEKVTGKIELGIKVFYKLGFEEEDNKHNELLKTPKEYMMERYERYSNRQKQINKILSVIEDAHKLLSGIAIESCYTKPMKNNLIFNASYLVENNKKKGFDNAVVEMKEKNPAYKILYSGPWPAYHFVNIVQEGEDDE